jgi:hypothetical protein
MSNLDMSCVPRRDHFPVPGPIEAVDAALQGRVREVREEMGAMVTAAIEAGTVPVAVVPTEVVGLDGARLAVQAAINMRG